MISRVAENCFWLSRYLERVENTARVLDVNQTLLLDLEVPLDQQWRPLLIISGILDFPGEAESEAVQNYVTWEVSNPSSIAASLAAARENARIIREVISAEMWERINFYHLWMQSVSARTIYDRARNDFYGQVRRINPLIQGLAEGTMSHGEAWEFFRLGKSLERACQTTRILDVKYHILLPTPQHVGTPIDNAHWLAILMSCSGYEPYHKKQRGTSDPGSAVADFLIFDPIFPRSVRHCLVECLQSVQTIGPMPAAAEGEAARLIRQELDWLKTHDVYALVRAGLHESLVGLVNRIHAIGDAIRRNYFDVRVEPATATGRLQVQSQNGVLQSFVADRGVEGRLAKKREETVMGATGPLVTCVR